MDIPDLRPGVVIQRLDEKPRLVIAVGSKLYVYKYLDASHTCAGHLITLNGYSILEGTNDSKIHSDL